MLMCISMNGVQVNKQYRLSVSKFVFKVCQLAEETEIDRNFSVTVDLHDGLLSLHVATQHEEGADNCSRTGTTVVTDHFYTTTGFQGFADETCTLVEEWVDVG